MYRRLTQSIVVSLSAYALAAYGGDSNPSLLPPDATPPTLTLSLQATKAFRFAWNSVAGSTHYNLLEDPTGHSGFTQAGADIAASVTSIDHIAPLHRRVNARYIVQACDAERCVESNTVHVSGSLAEAVGYFKASAVDASDQFGLSIDLSADGATLVVGARLEDSSATGINGDQNNNNAPESGAVYVFVREGTGAVWVQQAYIKASNTGAGDQFGAKLALSAEGSRLAVAAPQEDSNATGYNGNQNDNSAQGSGAVYIFERSSGVWAQRAYLKASDSAAHDNFGASLALSGATLAVGANLENSGATGINGDQLNSAAPDSGAVYVFVRKLSHLDGVFWMQQAYIKASNTGSGDRFGHSVALSGNVLAVGASSEDSAATGVGGNQLDNSASASGAVYVFSRVVSTWSQQAYVKASNTGANDVFGGSLTMSGDGATLAVGAYGEDSNARGVDGNQSNEMSPGAGAAYVFVRAGDSWTQQAYVKASNTEPHPLDPDSPGDSFGVSLELSLDGATLAVGASSESGSGVGINGPQESAIPGPGAGAVYVFERSNGVWAQQAYVKASNTGRNDVLGGSVALSADGATLAAGAAGEDGGDPGVNGDQNLEHPLGINANTGAVYVY
jgi:hypothetical protein